MHGGKKYYMKPKEAMNMVPATSKDRHVNYNGEQYVISTEEEQSLTCTTEQQGQSPLIIITTMQ